MRLRHVKGAVESIENHPLVNQKPKNIREDGMNSSAMTIPFILKSGWARVTSSSKTR